MSSLIVDITSIFFEERRFFKSVVILPKARRVEFPVTSGNSPGQNDYHNQTHGI